MTELRMPWSEDPSSCYTPPAIVELEDQPACDDNDADAQRAALERYPNFGRNDEADARHGLLPSSTTVRSGYQGAPRPAGGSTYGRCCVDQV